MKSFLLLMFGLVMSSCAPGPKVTTCVPNAMAGNFICFNEIENRKINQSPAQVDNWIFLSAADEQSFLTACENRLGGVKVSVCIFSALAMAFGCFNEITGQSFGILFKNASNYIGVSAVDEQILLTYCESLKK